MNKSTRSPKRKQQAPIAHPAFRSASSQIRSGAPLPAELAALSPIEIRELMRSIASAISEAQWSAGWMHNHEYSVWANCVELAAGRELSGKGDAEARLLLSLAEHIGQWFDPRPKNETDVPRGYTFMPLDEWRAHYAQSQSLL